jgi:hypothetical protein
MFAEVLGSQYADHASIGLRRFVLVVNVSERVLIVDANSEAGAVVLLKSSMAALEFENAGWTKLKVLFATELPVTRALLKARC